MSDVKIDEIFKDLLLDYPLYGEILLHVHREETTDDNVVPTACVTPD